MTTDSPRKPRESKVLSQGSVNQLLHELEGQLDGDEEDIILAAKAVLEQDEIEGRRFSLRVDMPIEESSNSSLSSESVVQSLAEALYWAGDNFALLDETVASWI